MEDYRKEVSKRMKNDKYMDLLTGQTDFIFQDIESYSRTEVVLVEDKISLVLDEYSSNFITCGTIPVFLQFL